jgi:mannose/fructose/N-acetylgalactosamine-specific phosphotransferase system component IIB
MRIDDRLIHGQIVTGWITYCEATKILVVDDRAVADPVQQMLLKLAVPSGITLEMLGKAAALRRLRNDQTGEKALLIMRSPAEANTFLEMGFEIGGINIGNISNSPSKTGRKKMMDYIYFEEQDAAALQALADRGVALDVRAVPTERSRDGLGLLAKYWSAQS